jgi:hypothetical protein
VALGVVLELAGAFGVGGGGLVVDNQQPSIKRRIAAERREGPVGLVLVVDHREGGDQEDRIRRNCEVGLGEGHDLDGVDVVCPEFRGVGIPGFSCHGDDDGRPAQTLRPTGAATTHRNHRLR